ncbi:hypothetical protein Tco_1476895, partial [Tanacetum coccineum]
LMEISIADQIALDDALVALADRLKIRKCNLVGSIFLNETLIYCQLCGI